VIEQPSAAARHEQLARDVRAARFESRVAQLVGEMITEGWDRKTATAIAREFAKAGA